MKKANETVKKTTPRKAMAAVFEYQHLLQSQRLHSSPGYLSPEAFEAQKVS